ncbi:transglycosylase SLT domain-containing protein [Gluconobacter wancherniae]|uniref:transglycosylase SLT domain-containing protein n=1 Tax=Gluconobacter wancherniae TaxID=1307955 RepID=UPI001B8B09A5|nr:transglycosylase SLT domain-containing protein [Gluconobacter wancherniae]MBS1088138.1 transglycosylase SLT domain-containing protein [Gluconobacter wancherniae]
MAQVPFANQAYKTPGSVDTGTVSAPKVQPLGSVVGDAFSQAGQMAGQIGDQIEKQNNEAAVNEAMTSFQNHIRNVQYGDPDNPDSKGFLTLQGKSAMDGWQGALQDIDSTRKQIAETLTPEQQRMYGQQSQSMQNSAFNGMASHVAGQREVWVRQSNIARSDQLRDAAVANRSDPAAMQSAIAGQMRIVDQQSQAEGLPLNDPIAIQRRSAVFGDTAKAMVHGYIADGDPIGAQHFLDANGKSLSDEVRNDLSITLHHPVIEKKAEIWARHEFGPSLQQLQPIARDANISDVLVSQEQAESGGRQFGKDGTVLRSMPGDADSPRGVMQIKPSTAKDAANYAGLPFDPSRLDSDAAYNRGLGHAEMYRLCAKYGNNFTLACAAYNWGQGNVDKAIKEYGDPRTGAVSDSDFLSHAPAETQKYVTKIQSGLQPQQPPPSSTAPDFEQATRNAMAGPDWEENMAKLSQVSRVQSIWEAETKTARTEVGQTLDNLNDQRLHGNMTGQFPPQAYRVLSTPELQTALNKFNAASDAGSQWKAVQWMPPAQQNAYLKQREDTLQNTDAPDYAIRREGLTQLASQVSRANEQLASDPAAYIQDHPAMQQVTADLQTAAQSSDPQRVAAAQAAYIQQSDAVQRTLGVTTPDVIPKAMSQKIADTLTNIDPEKTNVGAVLNGLREQYGDENWPRVVSQLHKYNQVSEDVGTLASMYLPTQVTDQAVFADMLHAKQIYMQSSGEKGGKGFLDGVNPPQMAYLNDTKAVHPIADKLSEFHSTLVNNPGGETTYGQVYNSVKSLAQWYVAKGDTGEDALSKAYDGIIGKAYDFSGPTRSPKGLMPATKSATRQVQNGISLADLGPVDGHIPGMTQEDRANKGLNAIKSNGIWVPTADDKGLQLVIPARVYGVSVVPKKTDGSPFTVQFEDIQKGNYKAPLPEDEGGGMSRVPGGPFVHAGQY